MDHYVDIDVRVDPDFASHQLMSVLYAKLHRALAARAGSEAGSGIGVSFPGFDPKAPYLGTRLRLHGSLADLSALMAGNWLAGMRDHVAVAPPAAVPPDAQHRPVRRVQVKSSPERLRRRLMRRHPIDEQEARKRIPDEVASLTRLPFVQLRSTSTGQPFRLFIEHGPLLPRAWPGNFNAYGLSREASVPWF